MESSSITILIGAFLAIASVVFGVKYKQGKGKATELTDLLSTIIKAAEDDEVTEEEFQRIVASVKALLGKGEAQSS